MNFEKSLLPNFVWWYPFAPALVGATTFVLGWTEEDWNFLGFGLPFTVMFFMFIWGASFLVGFVANIPGRAILLRLRSRPFLAATLSTLVVSCVAIVSVAIVSAGRILLRGEWTSSGFPTGIAIIGGATAALWLVDLRKRPQRPPVPAASTGEPTM
ncbi:hypothetical protein BH09ACT6_BH09ACT6_15660 [soil metagenome]